MNLTLIRASLVFLALGGTWLTALMATRPLVRGELPAPRSLVEPASNRRAEVRVDQGLVQRAIERPLFRADRHAPAASYDPERPVVSETPTEPPLPKPLLVVSGIVWGDKPAAVVEGLPGIEGPVVLRLGESVAGVGVVAIQAGRVVIRGLDTTWRLTVREPWQ